MCFSWVLLDLVCFWVLLLLAESISEHFSTVVPLALLSEKVLLENRSLNLGYLNVVFDGLNSCFREDVVSQDVSQIRERAVCDRGCYNSHSGNLSRFIASFVFEYHRIPY